jgi:hypothetical protein
VSFSKLQRELGVHHQLNWLLQAAELCGLPVIRKNKTLQRRAKLYAEANRIWTERLEASKERMVKLLAEHPTLERAEVARLFGAIPYEFLRKSDPVWLEARIGARRRRPKK